MSTALIVSLIFILILVIFIFFLIYQNANLNANYIDPGNCPSVQGDFGVKAGVVYYNDTRGEIAALYQCGPSGDQLCQQVVQNLKSAIDYCNTYPTICDAFIYDYSAGRVTIVDTTQNIRINELYDTYERQYPLNIV